MKSLKILRILLQLFVVIIFQLIYLDQLFIPLLITSLINVLYLIVILFTVFLKLDRLRNSYLLVIPDIFISSLYLVFINPLWLILLIIIQAVTIVFSENKYSKMLLALLFGLSFLAMIIQFIFRKDYISIFLLIPSVIAVFIYFKKLWETNHNRNKEHNYLKSLVDNKNKLLSTLTHELRTPLAVIKTSSELILEGRPGPINETQKSLLSSSLENTIRLTSLVENILSQVKVEFSWFSMKKKALDIRPLIRKIAIDIKPYLETKKQSLHYNYPGLLSRTVADNRWLQQVLLNLIHNGSKNSLEGSTLEISVKENEQCIVVSVHDFGKGIKNKEISHVFNEFYQSEDPTKNLNDGAGLGLTIVKDIVEKHGGNVYISSLPDSGTTVSFTLPVYKGVFSETFSSGN